MRYYIIAGEASGDLHGANLMRAIMRRDPEAEIRFWGGDAMTAVGGTRVRHIRDLAYMGFVEVAMHLPAVLGNIRFCKQDIEAFRPDALVYVDYPGFNLKIAKFAHKLGYKNIHYISPQLWAWKKGRITSMRRDLDRLCYILPFEQDFYSRNHFPQAVYVGHPLLDAVAQFRAENTSENPQNGATVALLPGSRRQELKKVLPPMLKLAAAHPEYRFVIAGMSLLGDAFYEPFIKDAANVSVVYDKTYELLSSSYAALVCSGTATLETALFNVPQVVCYSANALSIAIAKRFVGKRIKYISLPNLIADEPIVTELIQQDLNPQRLEEEFARITVQQGSRQQMLQGYARLHALLGNVGASDRTAQEIINIIGNKVTTQ
ncbi:MAG: lipid-A-disaccharide synthase [Bacteroidales bacterium]|nr:lipid-A-disaccharide synthase [Bacteroidales bacterium]